MVGRMRWLRTVSVLEDYVEKGSNKVICTDISCDGMLQGPSIALYKEILEHHPELYLMIASGGVSCAR